MNKIYTLLLVLFTCSSCQESPQTKFEMDGVSFISPKGWEITDQENMDDQGYYLSIEKEGFSSSGIITLFWMNAETDLNDWMDVYKGEMENNVIYKNSNLVFEEPIQDTFNNLNTTSLKFTVNLLGLKHEGIIHFFNEKNKAFSLLMQEAIEDKVKNNTGFEVIEQSFTVE